MGGGWTRKEWKRGEGLTPLDRAIKKKQEWNRLSLEERRKRKICPEKPPIYREVK